MAQQNIDHGGFIDDPSAESVYAAMVKIEANFTELYSLVSSVGDVDIHETPFSMVGVDPDASELSQVAEALNIKPVWTSPLGHLNVVSLYIPYYPGTLTPYFYRHFYAVKLGAGSYGDDGGLGETQELGRQHLIKLGVEINEPDTEVDYGDIGTTDIWTAVNAGSPFTKEGLTIITAIEDSVQKVYVFDGEEDTLYGSGETATTIDNFIDVNDGETLNAQLDEKASNPTSYPADRTVTIDDMFRMVIMTGSGPILTIDEFADEPIPVGSWFFAQGTATGGLKITYPITDGSDTLLVNSKDLVYCYHRAEDEWVVRKLGISPEEKSIRTHSWSLTAAQIKGGNTTPITISIPAPGAGKTFQGVFLRAKNNYGTAAFTNTGLWVRQIGATGNMFQIDALDNFIDATADKRIQCAIEDKSDPFVENVQMEVAMQSDEATGDGSIDLEMDYYIVDMP